VREAAFTPSSVGSTNVVSPLFDAALLSPESERATTTEVNLEDANNDHQQLVARSTGEKNSELGSDNQPSFEAEISAEDRPDIAQPLSDAALSSDELLRGHRAKLEARFTLADSENEFLEIMGSQERADLPFHSQRSRWNCGGKVSVRERASHLLRRLLRSRQHEKHAF
jgi:hypothetical protein